MALVGARFTVAPGIYGLPVSVYNDPLTLDGSARRNFPVNATAGPYSCVLFNYAPERGGDSMPPIDSLKKKLKRFNEFKLDQLPVDKCEQLLGNIDQRFVVLEADSDELYETSRKRLDENDASVLASVRHKLSRLNDEMDGLVRLRQKISDSIERRKIRQKMAERIGGPRILFLFEIMIIAMILAVLLDFQPGSLLSMQQLPPVLCLWIFL